MRKLKGKPPAGFYKISQFYLLNRRRKPICLQRGYSLLVSFAGDGFKLGRVMAAMKGKRVTCWFGEGHYRMRRVGADFVLD